MSTFGIPQAGIGVGVVILQDKKVLLGKRHPHSSQPGTWGLPGGKIDLNESPHKAAIRETKEECGLEITDLEFFCVVEGYEKEKQIFSMGFLVTNYKGIPAVTEPDKIVAWGWFPLDNLPKEIFSFSAQVVECFNSGKPYLPMDG